MDEKQAIRRLKRGDIGGLAALVRLYQARAVHAAYLITWDVALAEDVAQDVFLQVYKSIDHFDLDRPFAPWFMRSVMNAAVRAARRNRRDLSLDIFDADDACAAFADLFSDPGPDPDHAVEMNEIEQAVEQALSRLSPEQRAAVVLRYYFDLSDEEISNQLDCAPGTVRWRLHAARKQLRVLLRRWAGTAAPESR